MGFVRKKVRQCQFLDSSATQPFHAKKVLQDIFSAGNQTAVIEITKSKGPAHRFLANYQLGRFNKLLK